MSSCNKIYIPGYCGEQYGNVETTEMLAKLTMKIIENKKN